MLKQVETHYSEWLFFSNSNEISFSVLAWICKKILRCFHICTPFHQLLMFYTRWVEQGQIDKNLDILVLHESPLISGEHQPCQLNSKGYLNCKYSWACSMRLYGYLPVKLLWWAHKASIVIFHEKLLLLLTLTIHFSVIRLDQYFNLSILSNSTAKSLCSAHFCT